MEQSYFRMYWRAVDQEHAHIAAPAYATSYDNQVNKKDMDNGRSSNGHSGNS